MGAVSSPRYNSNILPFSLFPSPSLESSLPSFSHSLYFPSYCLPLHLIFWTAVQEVNTVYLLHLPSTGTKTLSSLKTSQASLGLGSFSLRLSHFAIGFSFSSVGVVMLYDVTYFCAPVQNPCLPPALTWSNARTCSPSQWPKRPFVGPNTNITFAQTNLAQCWPGSLIQLGNHIRRSDCGCLQEAIPPNPSIFHQPFQIFYQNFMPSLAHSPWTKQRNVSVT